MAEIPQPLVAMLTSYAADRLSEPLMSRKYLEAKETFWKYARKQRMLCVLQKSCEDELKHYGYDYEDVPFYEQDDSSGICFVPLPGKEAEYKHISTLFYISFIPVQNLAKAFKERVKQRQIPKQAELETQQYLKVLSENPSEQDLTYWKQILSEEEKEIINKHIDTIAILL